MILDTVIKAFTSILILLYLIKSFREKNKGNTLNSIYGMLWAIFMMMVLKL
ncbi:hypothetical protein KQI88_15905 [Alkaliphilus sp. MSJ-5]|uniref:Uncharacterized protein n=1 Tax=Alkaliphilus flagellatus TaxID=2841507 RepID=A0ABS6G5Z2_9FIRM|nr:hypothetical protein [Alkaliphilus flagellatus]MBU5677902.1 hypothetical protein [Alkaliphilus flagellatus]